MKNNERSDQLLLERMMKMAEQAYDTGWLKTRIFTFGVAFYIFVAGNRRHYKFGMCVEHSKSQPTDDKLSLKGAWSVVTVT